MTEKTIARALTIAGSDSGGGAGIQADLKTFAALGVFGVSAITALTAQNTQGVAGIHAVPADFVEQQITAVLSDIGADAAKTGMLATREIVLAVARAAERHGIERLVVDPVLLSKHGAPLLADDALGAYLTALLPRALIVTPNAPEAARLAGFNVADRDSQHRAAEAIAEMGPRYVLVKGGHLPDGAHVTDCLFDSREKTFREFVSPRSASPHTHGTGCVLSAAITAFLALDCEPVEAVERAIAFVHQAIRHGLAIGGGIGPVDPCWGIRPAVLYRAAGEAEPYNVNPQEH
ncbi:MAG: bifunctional hydroxymethylpyrimidine kinase/phosphomethylpyrimidine kinase [Candidatus Sumerlaeia bacterium]|nr:bifunctional hydroxymethylpyrimidine kinase/phosphomethylpyrimidine kinase [Candidatus Sumerlaeia bacterium]